MSPRSVDNPRPGLIDALIELVIDGRPAPDMEILGMLTLLIGGGFDTTTALTAHSLEWLGQNPDQRERLIHEHDTLLDSATEEFLRFYTPAPGDGRTFCRGRRDQRNPVQRGRTAVHLLGHGQPRPIVFPSPTRSSWTEKVTATSDSALASIAASGPT